jgi:hypothetical protein
MIFTRSYNVGVVEGSLILGSNISVKVLIIGLATGLKK